MTDCKARAAGFLLLHGNKNLVTLFFPPKVT